VPGPGKLGRGVPLRLDLTPAARGAISCYLLTITAGDSIMVTAIVLLNVERHRINETAEQLAGMDGISEVYSVSGMYDLVAIVRVKTNEDLSELVTRRLLQIEAIEDTDTMLAFKAYSRHDLESMFAI
jgi:DNA-binding Lrp family transcriptional regulator